MKHFSIHRWAAWAPGLQDDSSWIHWLNHPVALSDSGETPALVEMPANMRRRANRSGRAALQATYWSNPENNPIVFASRYGEIDRSVEMLEQLADEGTVSPTAFSMSVHNAVGALFSIAARHKGNYTAIASGEETVEAAFAEALGLLADGEPYVTVVYYDAPLPEPYRQFAEHEARLHAWACQIRLVESGGFSISPGASCARTDAPEIALPSDMKILRFLLVADHKTLMHESGKRCWLWERHD